MTDGGGKVAAALNTIDGVDRAARFLVGAARKGWRDDRIRALYKVRNPEKLRHLNG